MLVFFDRTDIQALKKMLVFPDHVTCNYSTAI